VLMTVLMCCCVDALMLNWLKGREMAWGINTSTRQQINTIINTSTHQHVNRSTDQQINIDHFQSESAKTQVSSKPLCFLLLGPLAEWIKRLTHYWNLCLPAGSNPSKDVCRFFPVFFSRKRFFLLSLCPFPTPKPSPLQFWHQHIDTVIITVISTPTLDFVLSGQNEDLFSLFPSSDSDLKCKLKQSCK
jgi:hypothetical protein